MISGDPEDDLATRQDPRLYPVGRALRATYDAENHDSLDPVATGLMLDLARVERGQEVPPPFVDARLAQTPATQGQATWMARVRGILSGRH